MPSPGFEPGSPRPQSKSDNLDRLAMGPALTGLVSLKWNQEKKASHLK